MSDILLLDGNCETVCAPPVDVADPVDPVEIRALLYCCCLAGGRGCGRGLALYGKYGL